MTLPPTNTFIAIGSSDIPHIFVFGSNMAGRHEKGAALHAKQNHGAVYGVGVVPTGDAYAIPTKDYRLRPLPLDVIASHVSDFIKYATRFDRTIFRVTAIGTGLAGYSHDQIAPLFRDAPINCILPDEWVTRHRGAKLPTSPDG